MAHEAELGARSHPAPHRERVGAIALAFGVLGAPLAWAARLIANYAFASNACFPGQSLQQQPVFGWVWFLLLALDLAAMAVAAFAAVTAHNNWTQSRGEFADHPHGLIEVGEGRTRFLSIWGIATSAGFFIALVFDFIALWIVPLCG